MRLRVAIVGAGIGAAHLDGYLAHPELFEVVTIADLDRKRAAPLTRRSGAAYSPSLEDTLGHAAPDVDIVDICLPPQLHKAAILACLAAGKHVVCEKPLVGSLRDLDDIEAAAANVNQLAMPVVTPVFQYRFGQGIGQLLHLIDRDLAGRPLVATLETHWNRGADYYAVPWRGKWETELGGAIVSHAIHIHDLLLRALGPARQVQAKLATAVNPIDVEDCAAIIFEMASGALVTSSITLGSADDRSRLRFCFSDLTAESGTEPYNPGTSPWTFTARAPAAQAEIDAVLASHRPHAEGFARQFELLHAAITDGRPPPVTLADARASLELITAIYQADATDRAITLPLDRSTPGYDGWMHLSET
ncbi:MAG: Gfo/Idh/MocA family oxidoreductase [Alphaproteobacteria bacterium]